MADTDPFGREQGEDPLAAMGWRDPAGAQTTAAPADIAVPEQPDHAAAREAGGEEVVAGVPGRQRRRGALGCAVATVLLFIGSVAAVVIPAVLSTVDDVREASPEVPTVPSIPAPEDGTTPSGAEPRGLERRSLLRRENLAPALQRLRRLAKSGRIRLVRLDAGTLLVQTSAGGDRTRYVQATWGGEASVVATSPGRPGKTFPWSRVDPAAPERIARAATRGRRTASFDYLVLTQLSDLSWSAFLRGGDGTFNASLDGRRVERVG